MNEIKNNLRFMAHPKRAPTVWLWQKWGLKKFPNGIEKVSKRAPGIRIGL
jgi:hypothetical protein